MKTQHPPWVTDAQVVQTLQAIDGDAFTSIDFVRCFADLFPDTWSNLLTIFGEKGDGRGRSYTAAVYLANRLWQVSKQPGGPLLPLARWQSGGVETPNQRLATPAERAMGADRIIRVFRKRPE